MRKKLEVKDEKQEHRSISVTSGEVYLFVELVGGKLKHAQITNISGDFPTATDIELWSTSQWNDLHIAIEETEKALGVKRSL